MLDKFHLVSVYDRLKLLVSRRLGKKQQKIAINVLSGLQVFSWVPIDLCANFIQTLEEKQSLQHAYAYSTSCGQD